MAEKTLQPSFSIENEPLGPGFRIAVEWPDRRVAHVTGFGTKEQARRWVENDAPNWIVNPDRLTVVDRLNPVTRFLVHHSKFMAMARLHSDQCYKIRRHLPVQETKQSAWYGPFESFADAWQVMDTLGLRNIGACRQCKPKPQALP